MPRGSAGEGERCVVAGLGVQPAAQDVVAGRRGHPVAGAPHLAGQPAPDHREDRGLAGRQRAGVAARLREAVVAAPLPVPAAVEVPTAVPTRSAPVAAPVTSAAPAGPLAGGPCTDDMIAVDVRPESASSPVGGKPTFDLVVTNVSPVACVRALDKGLQEIVLLDGSGNRLWGSNDCFPEASSDTRTLQPGEVVVFPVLWSGLSSAPGCTADRTTPGAGSYVLRGRLDTKTSGDAALTLT